MVVHSTSMEQAIIIKQKSVRDYLRFLCKKKKMTKRLIIIFVSIRVSLKKIYTVPCFLTYFE